MPNKELQFTTVSSEIFQSLLDLDGMFHPMPQCKNKQLLDLGLVL